MLPRDWCSFPMGKLSVLRYGLVVRIAGSHPAGPGSIPGNGNLLVCLAWTDVVTVVNPWGIQGGYAAVVLFWGRGRKKFYDEDGIRTHAGRAHWISSPTP